MLIFVEFRTYARSGGNPNKQVHTLNMIAMPRKLRLDTTTKLSTDSTYSCCQYHKICSHSAFGQNKLHRKREREREREISIKNTGDFLCDNLLMVDINSVVSSLGKSIFSNDTSIIMTSMKGFSLLITILVISIFYLDALVLPFFPSHRINHHNYRTGVSKKKKGTYNAVLNAGLYSSSNSNEEEKRDKEQALGHEDIVWKLRPPPETSRLERLKLRFAANLIRLDCFIKREAPPVALCPKGGQALLEAYYQNEKIARFGFSTERGPPAPPIQETVFDLYKISPNTMVGVAAIIYMFVEPKYRKRDVGSLALQVISLIHGIQGCDFTVLVVDDNGSGKLNDWYEKNGFSKAPKLQAILGSPDAVNGITMIAPTNRILPNGCHIQWW